MELTYRQEQIYNFLLDNYNEGNVSYIGKLEIAQAIGLNVNKHETRLLRTIEAEVRNINENDNVEKIIVSSPKGYKIGNQEETQKYIKNRFVRDLKNLKLNWKLKTKAGLDGQLYADLVNEELKEIKVY